MRVRAVDDYYLGLVILGIAVAFIGGFWYGAAAFGLFLIVGSFVR